MRRRFAPGCHSMIVWRVRALNVWRFWQHVNNLVRLFNRSFLLFWFLYWCTAVPRIIWFVSFAAKLNITSKICPPTSIWSLSTPPIVNVASLADLILTWIGCPFLIILSHDMISNQIRTCFSVEYCGQNFPFVLISGVRRRYIVALCNEPLGFFKHGDFVLMRAWNCCKVFLTVFFRMAFLTSPLVQMWPYSPIMFLHETRLMSLNPPET